MEIGLYLYSEHWLLSSEFYPWKKVKVVPLEISSPGMVFSNVNYVSAHSQSPAEFFTALQPYLEVDLVRNTPKAPQWVVASVHKCKAAVTSSLCCQRPSAGISGLAYLFLRWPGSCSLKSTVPVLLSFLSQAWEERYSQIYIIEKKFDKYSNMCFNGNIVFGLMTADVLL